MYETKRQIEVMKAYEEGKAIQYRGKCTKDDVWNDTKYPSWNWYSVDYRVKPDEAKKPKKFMTCLQLAELLAKGYGQTAYFYRDGTAGPVGSSFEYEKDNEEDSISVMRKIRPWGSDEWLDPTVDIYEEFMNSKEKERRYQNIKISIKKLNGDDFEVESEPDEETIKDYSDCCSVEPEIGEVFRYKGLTLRCEEGGCGDGCALLKHPCYAFECMKGERVDGKGVHFVDVSKKEKPTASEDSSSIQGECIGVHKRTPQEIADFFGCYVAYDSSIGSFSTYEKPPVFSGEFCWIVSDRFVATTDSCKEKHIIYRPHQEPIVNEEEDDD